MTFRAQWGIPAPMALLQATHVAILTGLTCMLVAVCLELHTSGSADLGSWEKPYPHGSTGHFPGRDSLQ